MKRLITGLLILIFVLIFAAGVIAISARGALNAIERQSKNIVGLSLDVESYRINWLKAAISLKGIKIYPAGEKDLLASAQELSIRIMPTALFKKTLHAKSITLIKPTINITEYRRNKYNWDALNLGEKDKNDKDDEWHVWIESVKIKDGILNYQDRVGGHRIKLTSVSMSLKNITSEPNPKKLPTMLYMKSKIDNNKGNLTLRGRLNAFAEGINFKIRSRIDDAPVTYFRSFYAGETPFPIRSGRMTMTSKLTAKMSKLVAYNHATIYNLKAGGDMRGKLINAFVLSLSGPVEVDVTVKGDLEEGDFRTGSALSRGIGQNIFAQANNANPLKGTGKAIKEAGSSVGRGIKKLFGR
ncbi:MAG: DUF748 domain-containing protein [Pseudomonadota bacterium]